MACACFGDRLFSRASNWWGRWTTTTPSPTLLPHERDRACFVKRNAVDPDLSRDLVFLCFSIILDASASWLDLTLWCPNTIVGTALWLHEAFSEVRATVPRPLTVPKVGKVQDYLAWVDLLIRNIWNHGGIFPGFSFKCTSLTVFWLNMSRFILRLRRPGCQLFQKS